MSVSSVDTAARPRFAGMWLLLATPAVAMFLAANVANAGNLVFNMLFSRWMGPELFADLATLLTLKLSLLALLNALQMAVSQEVSAQRGRPIDTALSVLGRVLFLALGAVVPFLLPAALGGALGDTIGITSGYALAILIVALPVTAPLCVARGVATGRLEVGRIVLSANVEMIVRLAGAVAAWQAGLGIEGVIAAMALSMVAGWLPVRGAMHSVAQVAFAPVARRIAFLAFPFAVLQASQVMHLDGDVLVANAFLTSTETGLVAVLCLFQRIQFFACFGLAAALLPSVSAAVAEGRSGVREAMPVVKLFLAVTFTLMAMLVAFPQMVIGLLAGPGFAAAAEALPLAGLCAALFTLSYLVATFLAALGDRRGIWLIACFVPVQFAGFAWFGMTEVGIGLHGMFAVKAACQGVLAVGMLTLIPLRLRQQSEYAAKS
jgi:O-antigen/teichoic acid export membrane protein